MLADDQWSRCNTRGPYGIYIWTAGQWENHKSRSKFVWKFINGDQRSMGYTNWDSGQPDNSDGKEACVNLWKKYGYKWNDEPCGHRYCFVCEERSIPI